MQMLEKRLLPLQAVLDGTQILVEGLPPLLVSPISARKIKPQDLCTSLRLIITTALASHMISPELWYR